MHSGDEARLGAGPAVGAYQPLPTVAPGPDVLGHAAPQLHRELGLAAAADRFGLRGRVEACGAGLDTARDQGRSVLPLPPPRPTGSGP